MASAPLGAQDRPAIEREGDSLRVALTAPMRHALADRFPGFRPWQPADYVPWLRMPHDFDETQALSVVIADLNGDGLEDVALAGRVAGPASVLFALVSRAGAYEVAEIERVPLREPVGAGTDRLLGTYMRRVPPGRYEASCWDGHEAQPVLELDTDAIAVSWADKATLIHHYENGAFQPFDWHTC